MAAKVGYTVREDKQHELQKQLGCMNGIFHLLDRGSLLGLHRHWPNQNRLTAGQVENGEKELKKYSEKAKVRNQRKMKIEKNRASVDSSRSSCSSSSSSTTFSSFHRSKRVQTEWSAREPDIRDVVKDSMTRVTRVTKDERAGYVMNHVDSPRPSMHQNVIQYDRKDQNLTKIYKTSSEVKKVKEVSRFSCDEIERESKYSLKSIYNVNELPRLSLDGKQNSKKNLMNRSPSGIVARLMGLDSLTDSNCKVETLKVKPPFVDQSGSHSPKVHKKIKPALQQHDGGDCGSIPSGEDFRALKQIVEAMQMTKTALENIKNDQPGSPTVKGTNSPRKHDLLNRAVKPAKMAIEPVMVMGLHDNNQKAKKQVRDSSPRNSKANGTASRSLEDLTGERPILNPRMQRSKNDIEKQCFNGPASDSSRVKKQSVLKTRCAKIKPVSPMQDSDQSCMFSNETRNLRHDGDTLNSVKSESKPEVSTQNNFAEKLIEDKPLVELAKLTMEQASPVSVLDAFYVEDTPSPVKKRPNAFNEYENLRVDETEWNQVGIYNLATPADASEFDQPKLPNSTDGERAKFPCNSATEDHKYIRDILLASGFLKDPDSAIRLAQLQSTGSMIKPELFHILEKTNEECHKSNPSLNPNEKVRRKMIFDFVNDTLFYKCVMSGFSEKRCVRFVDGEKLLTELWLEIDHLQSSSERCIYDEDDEIKVIVSADMNKSSQVWDTYCYEVSGLVLNIERLIFKDLVDEVVNADATVVQDRLARHCRRLF